MLFYDLFEEHCQNLEFWFLTILIFSIKLIRDGLFLNSNNIYKSFDVYFLIIFFQIIYAHCKMRYIYCRYQNLSYLAFKNYWSLIFSTFILRDSLQLQRTLKIFLMSQGLFVLFIVCFLLKCTIVCSQWCSPISLQANSALERS